jgi:hypothetical protein
MVEPDFTPMPVYGAMKAYTTNLSPALYPGTHQEDHWALAYEGSWQLGGEGGDLSLYQRSDEGGAAVRFAFEGAGLTLVPGPERGEIEVLLGGGDAERVSLEGEPVRLFRHWREGRHEVTLNVVSGHVSVDEVVVRAAWRPPRWTILGGVGLMLTVAWLSACVVRRS